MGKDNSHWVVGRLEDVGDVEVKSGGFQKVRFGMEVPDGDFRPSYVEFWLLGKNVGKAEGLEIGASYLVRFSARGHRIVSSRGGWKYFNELSAFVVERKG